MTNRPRIAVIIPTLNEEAVIADVLAHLQRAAVAEIIVADGGSRDATVEIARRSSAQVITSVRGRGSQMNAGAAHAHGDVLLFLHADTILPPDATQMIARAFNDPDVVGGCFRLSFDQPDMVLALSAWCTRFESYATTFGDQAFFVRRSVFAAVGGFPPQPLMEDVELRRMLKRRGRFVKLPACVTTSARRFMKRGPLRQQALNAALLAGYTLGIPADQLQQLYEGGAHERSTQVLRS